MRCRYPFGHFPFIPASGVLSAGLTLAQAMRWYWQVSEWNVQVSFGSPIITDTSTGDTFTFGAANAANVSQKQFGTDGSGNPIPNSEVSLVLATPFTLVVAPATITCSYASDPGPPNVTTGGGVASFTLFPMGLIDPEDPDSAYYTPMTYDAASGLYLPGYSAVCNVELAGTPASGGPYRFFQLTYVSGYAAPADGIFNAPMAVVVDGITMGTVDGNYYFGTATGSGPSTGATLTAPDPVTMTCTPNAFWSYEGDYDSDSTPLYDAHTGALLFSPLQIIQAPCP